MNDIGLMFDMLAVGMWTEERGSRQAHNNRNSVTAHSSVVAAVAGKLPICFEGRGASIDQ